MKKFIYAFAESDRDTLLSQGYTLLKADNIKKIKATLSVENENGQNMLYFLMDFENFFA